MSGSGPAIRADAIVVAAGGSTRMGGVDKLAMEIGGRPLLAWTLDALAAAPEVERMVVVTSADRVAGLSGASWLPGRVVDVVGGGARRQESVRAGFDALDRGGTTDPARVVLVHDAARPLVRPELIAAVVTATARHGAAIPVVPVAETLKRIDGEVVGGTIDREGIGAAQTPQGARTGILRDAYARFPADGPDTFTDEASLLEACGVAVHVVAGDPGNLKVTVPGDVARAASRLVGQGIGGAGLATTRTGIGQDSHAFGPAMSLMLGGIEIAGAPRLHGHSDGDVALHALADALLGAAGLGDLGRLFPADARTPTGIASSELIADVCRRIGSAGWRPASADLTIVAARPRLGAYLDAMRVQIAGLLGLDPSAVNVKASSGNLQGPDGAGRSMSAIAIATLEADR